MSEERVSCTWVSCEMRIGIVSNAFPRFSGDYYGVFVWELAHFLQEREHEVHVVTGRRLGTEPEGEYQGVLVHRFNYLGWKSDNRPGELGTRPWRLLSLVLEGRRCLVHVVRQYQLELIHAYWLLPSGLIGVLGHYATGLPVVATAPGSDLNVMPQRRIPRAFLRFVLPRLDALIAEGTALRETAIRLGVRSERAHLILGDGGIDGTLFAPPAQRDRRPVILFVGGLTPPKRLDTLLEAMPEVLRRCPEARLRVVGGGEDRSKWEVLAEQLGIAEAVTFVGPLPHEQVPEEMRRAAVLALCSDHEGLPSAIMEALMCGLPVVATRVGGIPDLIQDNENGFLVDTNDVGGLAARLTEILSDHSLARRLGNNARALAVQYLSKDVIIPKIEKLYLEAIKEH